MRLTFDAPPNKDNEYYVSMSSTTVSYANFPVSAAGGNQRTPNAQQPPKLEEKESENIYSSVDNIYSNVRHENVTAVSEDRYNLQSQIESVQETTLVPVEEDSTEQPSLFERVKKNLTSKKCWVIAPLALGALTATALGAYYGVAASLSHSNISSFNKLTPNFTPPFLTNQNLFANISKEAEINVTELPSHLKTPFSTTLKLPNTTNSPDCDRQSCFFPDNFPSEIKSKSAPEKSSLCTSSKGEKYLICECSSSWCQLNAATNIPSILKEIPCKPTGWTIFKTRSDSMIYPKKLEISFYCKTNRVDYS